MLSNQQTSSQQSSPAGEAISQNARPAPRPQDMRLYQRGRLYQRLSMVITYIILIIAAFIVLLPFAWLLSASLKNTAQYYASPIQWIPNPFVWSNYVEAFVVYG